MATALAEFERAMQDANGRCVRYGGSLSTAAVAPRLSDLAALEAALLDDLLFVLLGLDGRLIATRLVAPVPQHADLDDGADEDHGADDGELGGEDDPASSDDDDDDDATDEAARRRLRNWNARPRTICFTYDALQQHLTHADGGAVSPAAAAPLLQLVDRFAAVCNHYAFVRWFALRQRRARCGVVAHAVSEWLRHTLDDYQEMVAQLESELLVAASPRLSLQRVWFYLQPAMAALETLDRVCRAMAASRARGGALLRLIYVQYMSLGSQHARDVLVELLRVAAAPVLQMLHQWLQRGSTRDPYAEFFVQPPDARGDTADTSVTATTASSAYAWRLVPEHVPPFLDALAARILEAGNYLRAMDRLSTLDAAADEPHADGSQLQPLSPLDAPNHEAPTFSTDEQHYVPYVEAAHQSANGRLLGILRAKSLGDLFRFLAESFLMQNGHCYAQFLDAAIDDIRELSGSIATATAAATTATERAVALKPKLDRLSAVLRVNLRTSATAEASEFEPFLRVQLIADAIPEHARVCNASNDALNPALALVLLSNDATSADRAYTLESFVATAVQALEHQQKPTPGKYIGPLDLAFTSVTVYAYQPTNQPRRTLALEAFCLDFQAPWPLSLVVSAEVIIKYKLLFRLLFKMTTTQRELSATWSALHSLKNVRACRRECDCVGVRLQWSHAHAHARTVSGASKLVVSIVCTSESNDLCRSNDHVLFQLARHSSKRGAVRATGSKRCNSTSRASLPRVTDWPATESSIDQPQGITNACGWLCDVVGARAGDTA